MGVLRLCPVCLKGKGLPLHLRVQGVTETLRGFGHAGSEVCDMLLLLCSDDTLRSNPIPQDRRGRDPAEDFQGPEVAGDQLTPPFGLGPDPGPPLTPPSKPHLPSLALEHTALRSGDVHSIGDPSQPPLFKVSLKGELSD